VAGAESSRPGLRATSVFRCVRTLSLASVAGAKTSRPGLRATSLCVRTLSLAMCGRGKVLAPGSSRNVAVPGHEDIAPATRNSTARDRSVNVVRLHASFKPPPIPPTRARLSCVCGRGKVLAPRSSSDVAFPVRVDIVLGNVWPGQSLRAPVFERRRSSGARGLYPWQVWPWQSPRAPVFERRRCFGA
jgi:hypothetical protein